MRAKMAAADSGGKVPTTVRLTPEVYAKLKAMAAVMKAPIGIVMEHLVTVADIDRLPVLKRGYTPVEKSE